MGREKIQKNIAYDTERKLYYVTFVYGADSNGKTIRKRKTFDKKIDAVAALKEFELNKLKGDVVLPKEITVQQFIEYWLNDIKSINCEETTIYGYKNIINKHINPYMGKLKLQTITPSIINKYISMLSKEKELSNNTIKKHYNLLFDVFKVAVSEDKMLKNPLDKVEKIKVNRKEQNCYNIEQLKILLDIVKNDRMGIVIVLAGALGLRREEIAGLKWCNIDFENDLINIVEARTQAGNNVIIEDTKTLSSHRILSMPSAVKTLLLYNKSIQDEQKELLKDNYLYTDYVVVWENGEPYRPNYLSDLFKKIIDDNKLPPIRLHDLRHTFASIANDLGVPMYDISKALGHGDISTTSSTYTHMFDKTHKKAIKKVAGILDY